MVLNWICDQKVVRVADSRAVNMCGLVITACALEAIFRESLCFPVTWVHLSIATGTKKMHTGRSYLFRMRLYHITHCFAHCLCCEVSAVRGPDRREHENVEASVNLYEVLPFTITCARLRHYVETP